MVCIAIFSTLEWRQNGHDGVSNYQPNDCLLNNLCRHRSKKTFKLRVTGLCEGNSLVTGEFPAQGVSNAENIFIWWRHHDISLWCVSSDHRGIQGIVSNIIILHIRHHLWHWQSLAMNAIILCNVPLAKRDVHVNKALAFLTHWGRDKMTAISQTTLSITFSSMRMLEFRLKFQLSLFLRVQSQYSSIGSDNGLSPNRRQAIILTNDGLSFWRIYASLGLNELRP